MIWRITDFYNSQMIYTVRMSGVVIENLTDVHIDWARDLLVEHWGATESVTRGRIHRCDKLPGFVALHDSKRIGLLTYNIEDGRCEVVTLNSTKEGIGVGSALLNAAKATAIDAGCSRLWLITTNDNQRAIRFYEHYGFTIYAIHEDAMDESRKLKPGIPLLGMNGIPIKDEIEMEIIL